MNKREKLESLKQNILEGCKKTEASDYITDERINIKKDNKNNYYLLIEVKNPNVRKSPEEKDNIKSVNKQIKTVCQNCIHHTKNARLIENPDNKPMDFQIKYIKIEI